MRRPPLLLPLLQLLQLHAALPDSQPRGAVCAIINDTDVIGANLKWEHKPNPSDCCAGCEATA